jgi:hypothetical protein
MKIWKLRLNWALGHQVIAKVETTLGLWESTLCGYMVWPIPTLLIINLGALGSHCLLQTYIEYYWVALWTHH